MRAIRRYLIRLTSSLTRRRADARLAEELQQHLDQQIADNIRSGLAPSEARRQARLKLGAVEAIRERYQDERSLPRIETLLADLRYAGRVMLRAPLFAMAVIGVLALGIGANTAIFSLVNAVLLRPLPLEDPDRLVRLFTKLPSGGLFELSPGKFYDWQRHARSFEAMAIFPCCGFRELALTGTGTARTVRASAVSTGFFDLVRVKPALGRVFEPNEDTPEGKSVVVLSAAFWRTEFGGDPNAIGRSLRLNDTPYAVVGVLPAEASVASWTTMAADVWIPLGISEKSRTSRGNHYLDGVARLKPGVEPAEAQAEVDAIAGRLGVEFPATDAGWGAVVVPLQEVIVGNSRAMLFILLGAVGLVLLIACANVGNLLFTRALNRRREIAIRAALGAWRGRVFQQLLTEAVVLAGVGGALGILFAYGALSSASGLLADHLPRAAEVAIDGRVLLFALAMSVVTGAMLGTFPAARAVRTDLNEVLKEGERGHGTVSVRTRRLLIVCEVALSLVLLMGAGVMAQSLLALRHGEAGFNPQNVLTMMVRLVDRRYPTPEQKVAFFEGALQRVRALPGVDAAGTIDDLPFTPGSSQTLLLEGAPPQREPAAVQARQIRPGYLSAMGIPVLRGRDVLESDGEVLLVSREAAKLYWGDDDPIGRRAALPFSKDVLREVVGVIGDVKQRTPIEGYTPSVYFYTHNPYAKATFVIRTSVVPATLAQSAVAAIRAMDPEQPVEHVRTMEQVRDEKLTSQRFSALLLGVFAGLALLLAAVGIFSVLAYIVRSRRREIGIRTALGAGTVDVVRLVIVEVMSPVLVGIAVGVVAALASARVLSTVAFGVSASDPMTLAVVGATLVGVALVASAVPAYRATRLDPVKVLRAD